MASAQDKAQAQETDLEKDDVVEKAKDIGKDLGVTNAGDGKEELPDYEVIEEDKPLAKEREPKPERKQFTNKEKRDLRKKRVQEKFQAKDAIIESQQQQINQLAGKLNEFEGRLSNVDRTKVDEMLNQAIVNFQRAEKDHMESFKEGDGEKATRAMKVMYESQRQIDQLQPIKQKLDAKPQQVQPQKADNAPDPILAKKVAAWEAKNEWYKSDGSDEDSEIAKTISGKMVNEGFDPKSDDFWDELTDRLEKRGIGKVEEEQDEEEDEPAPVAKRRSPPVSGGAKRGDAGGKVQVTLPTAFIQACKDSGKWEDETTRKRMIKRYLDGLKENQT